MKKNDRILWTNKESELKGLRHQVDREYPELLPKEKEELVRELNTDILLRIRSTLNYYLDRPIILFGTFSRWDGKRRGVMELDSFNIKDCFYSNCDMVTWYLDEKGDLRCKATHEAGTNHYLYRFWKEDVTDRQKKNLLDRLAAGRDISYDVHLLTKSVGREICKIYQWEDKNKKERIG